MTLLEHAYAQSLCPHRPQRLRGDAACYSTSRERPIAPSSKSALDQLRPWPRNARTHSKKQIKQIAESIRRFGFTNPVLIDGESRILAGHGRVEAARSLGLPTAPCLRFDHLSAADKRAYVNRRQ